MAGLVGIYSPNWYNSIPLQPSIYFPNYILFLTGSTILNIVTGHYYCPVCLVGPSSKLFCQTLSYREPAHWFCI